MPTNSTPGVHAIFGKITGGGRTRYMYAPELITVFSSSEPPQLSIAGGQDILPRIDITGLPGQRVVLESSTDLNTWQPLSTNWMSTFVWSYFDLEALRVKLFYRAILQ
jgi:hypothetical protein